MYLLSVYYDPDTLIEVWKSLKNKIKITIPHFWILSKEKHLDSNREKERHFRMKYHN
jgi:hypothetical protein